MVWGLEVVPRKMSNRKGAMFMAEKKAKDEGIAASDDGVVSRLHDAYKDNPEKPDPSSIAQVQVLKDEA